MVSIPPRPPDFESIMLQDFKTIWPYLDDLRPVDSKGAYLHWDKLRFRAPPEGLSSEQYWVATRWLRRVAAEQTPFTDKQENIFAYYELGQVKAVLHEIDSQARGSFESDHHLPAEAEGQRYLIRSLLEEPFSSSTLEGAATTRAIAKKLTQEGRHPRNLSEQMVLNNYLAMRFIKEIQGEPLTPEILREIHRIITKGTLEDPRKAGEFRQLKDDITVQNEITGEVLHIPPMADQLPGRVEALCAFANKENEVLSFVHPIIRAILLHFMLAYDHPFVDGNGRTARALFYWSVLRDQYWLLEYISISKVINQAPAKYGMAFLYSETDQGDMTYFLIHQLDVIKKAIEGLYGYLNDKSEELKQAKKSITDSGLAQRLNYRQLQLLDDSIKNPQYEFIIVDHQKLHGISYLTARKDLEALVAEKLFQKSSKGRTSIYKSAKDIASKLKGSA